MSVASGPSHAAYTWAVHGGFGNQTVVDKVPPEMLHLVDPHWYQFAPMNPLWHAILGFVIGVLGMISIIGNGMVIYIFTTTKSLRTPSNLLVINLAISDFLMMVAMSPTMVCTTIRNEQTVVRRWQEHFHVNHNLRLTMHAGDQLLLRDVDDGTLVL